MTFLERLEWLNCLSQWLSWLPERLLGDCLKGQCFGECWLHTWALSLGPPPTSSSPFPARVKGEQNGFQWQTSAADGASLRRTHWIGTGSLENAPGPFPSTGCVLFELSTPLRQGQWGDGIRWSPFWRKTVLEAPPPKIPDHQAQHLSAFLTITVNKECGLKKKKNFALESRAKIQVEMCLP